ncbi:hypothetical protein D3C71_1377570 [compost metagenome]
MHILYIEIVFLHCPNFIEDLFPFGNRIYQLLDTIQFYCTCSWRRNFLSGVHNIITIPCLIQHFLAISTDHKTTGILNQCLIFQIFKIIGSDGTSALIGQLVWNQAIQIPIGTYRQR